MFARILVPTDFSEPSDAALEYARMIAARFRSSLHLLHVSETHAYFAGISAEVYVTDASAIQAELTDKAMNRQMQSLTPDDRQRYKATWEIVSGPSARRIVEYAAERNIDLIVMGTHGRSGMSHLLMGSVAEKVVRTAPCPVMTVRHRPVMAADIPKNLLRELSCHSCPFLAAPSTSS